MTRSLMSILFPNREKNKKMKIEELRTDLNNAVSRIAHLEAQLSSANEIIESLSTCVKEVAFATENLSAELISITHVIQQAASASQAEVLRMPWETKKDDDDGYLN